MNSALVTTGILPLTVGSKKLFQFAGTLNGQWWSLSGGSATLLMTDPSGTQYSYSATIQNGGAVYPWTVLNVPGTWVRSWDVTDASGIRQITLPLTFTVIVSPGTPF